MFASQKTGRSLPTRPVQKPSFEALEDRQHFSVYTVTTNADSGNGSLRAAIQAVDAGKDNTINFDLPKSQSANGMWTIQLQSALPQITAAVSIDGNSQPGFSNKPVVQLDGSSKMTCFDQVSGGALTVTHLQMNNFDLPVEVTAPQSNISDNVITLQSSTYWGGIGLYSGGNDTVSGNTITAYTPGSFANADSAIYVSASTSNNISGNTISGFYIGVCLDTGASGNTISKNTIKYCGGGIDLIASTAWENKLLGNVITGSTAVGIEVESDGNTIGTIGDGNTVTNTNAAASGTGIVISGSSNTVSGNTSSSNSDFGVVVEVGSHNTVNGNTLVGNHSGGVQINSADNMIGGYTKADGNAISSPTLGVEVTYGPLSGNTILGNSIAVPNGFQGIIFTSDASANQAAPVLTSALGVAGGPAKVYGSVHSVANSTVRVELFASAVEPDDFAPDLVGNEGETFLGYVDVTTNAQGNAVFSASVSSKYGQMFTATATEAGNTSEFSNAVTEFAANPFKPTPIRPIEHI